MSLELIKESIKVSNMIGENATQTVVENDIIVPDVKPDVGRILMMDGDVMVNKCTAMQGKMLVDGTIQYKILYLSDDESNSIKSISTNTDFSHTFDLEGSEQGMRCSAKCDIEHTDFNILNGRKINVKSIVKVTGKVTDIVEQDIVTGMDGLDDIQVLKNNLKVNCFVGSSEEECSVRENLELPAGKPPIKEILRSDIKITGKDYKIADNKIIAKGELNISTLYIGEGEDRNIQFMEHEIPFTQFIDIPGVTDEISCDVDYKIVESAFEPAEDSDGELRLLNVDVKVDLSAVCFEKRNIEVIEDAYSPSMRVSLHKDLFTMEEVIAESREQVSVKDSVLPDEESPEIMEVFNVISKPGSVEYSIVGDKVIIDGVIENNILYLAKDTDQPLLCIKQETPFKHSMDVKGMKPDMLCNIDVDIDHCNYSMVSSNEIEIRLVVTAVLKMVNLVSVPLIVKTEEQPIDDRKILNQPSIIIYFAQVGDTLWKVAKKYYTTVEDIRKMNGSLEAESITAGQQIIIPRKVKK